MAMIPGIGLLRELESADTAEHALAARAVEKINRCERRFYPSAVRLCKPYIILHPRPLML
jgi:hypothetical protein